MITISEEKLKNVDTTLGLMRTYDEELGIPILRYTEPKLFKKPETANSEFVDVAVEVKMQLGNIPFNENILTKKIPEIHVAFARNMIKYMKSQGLVKEEGHNNRVIFI